MRIRSRALVGATLAVTALTLTACSATTPAADQDPIQIWVPYPTSFEAPMLAAADACAAEGVEIEVTPFDLSYGELDLKVQAEAQAGNAPDLIVAGLNSVIPMLSNDFVVELSPYLEGDDVVTEEIMPALAAGRIDGEQLIVPWGISVPALFYNADILTAAGVDPESLTTWDAVEEASAAISAAGHYSISFPQQEGWLPLQYLLTAGTELVGDDGAAVFNDAAGDRAIEHFNRLYRELNAFPGDETASREAFAAGEVGMFVGSSAFISSFAEAPFAWSTVAFPAAEEGGDVVTAAGGAGIAMFATEDRRELAWQALLCTLDPELLAEFAVGTIGYMPVRSDMADALEPGLLEEAPYAAPWSQFGLAGPWLNFPGVDGPRALQAFNEAWIEAAQRSDDPTGLMDGAAAEIDGLLG